MCETAGDNVSLIDSPKNRVLEQIHVAAPAPAVFDPMQPPLLQITGLSKSFGGVQALSGVNLTLAAGEVHALCGENGAGKSTLNKIVSGALLPDTGTVVLNGTPLRLGSLRACEQAGVAIIHQESTAFPHLDAQDNLFVGREPTRAAGLLLDRRLLRRQTGELLSRLGQTIDPTRPVGELTVAQQQMVALARALSRSCRLLIMDEPTASLSERETRVLFRLVRRLRDEGVGILYVSHRLEEVFALADRVTVLRDGCLVGTRKVAEVTSEELVRMMVGRDIVGEDVSPSTRGECRNKPLLQVQGLSREAVFHDVSFEVHAGEIVGVAGLVGAGRSEVARAVFGIDPLDTGTVTVAGKPLSVSSPQAALRAGVALVPEDRQHQGLAVEMAVAENLSLAVLKSLTRGGLLSRRNEEQLAERLIGELGIRTPGVWAPTESLSGGNQQKVLLGKWLAAEPRVLILDEPTRGVDVGAKAEVHRLMRELTARGVGILMISSELPEILSLSDRILVMREGQVVEELPGEGATEEQLLQLALSGSPGGASTTAGANLPAQPAREVREDVVAGARSAEPRCPEKLRKAGTTWKDWARSAASRREYGVAALLALTVAAVSLVNPSFLQAENIRDMLVQVAPAAIVACGLTLVLVTREIDISVGSLMGLLAAVVGILSSPDRVGLPVSAAVVVTLLLGAGIGLLTGSLVTFGQVPSIIVTLGMLTALRGVTELLMGGEWVVNLPSGLRFWGIGRILGLDVCLWVALAAILVTSVLARSTPLGRRLYAVGSNPKAAWLAGLSERRLKLFAFTFTGFLTALATLVSVPQLSVIESGIGVGFELLVVTCVVVGGTSINGGKGSVLGSVLGVVLLGIVATVLIFLKLGEMATYWERAIQGAFILAAVLADHLARRGTAGEAPE